MTDRRRAIRFLVSSAAPGEARVLHDVTVESVVANLATIIAPAPAHVDEQLFLQVSNVDGSITTWAGSVRSSAPVRHGDPASFRIELQLTGSTQTQASSPEEIAGT